MKLPALLLCSLAVNTALLAAFSLRPACAPAAVREFFISDASRAAAHAASARRERARAAAHARAAALQAAAERTRLWATLDSPDLRTFVARLRAAGFSPAVIRAMVGARLDARFAIRKSELVRTVDVPFWKPEPFSSLHNPRFYEAQSQISRDRTKALREILGDDYFAGSAFEITAEQRRKFGDLPSGKVELVRRIVDDYADMTSQVRAATQGILLPEDRAQLALLEKEKRADLAAVLTPAELEDFEMRNSPMLARTRTALTLMDATEEEFRAIYRVQLPFADALFPPASSYSAEQNRRRHEALRQVADQLTVALGAARCADYTRANNTEYQGLFRLGQREGVAPDAINRAYALRTAATEESVRIQGAGLGAAERSAALGALAAATKNKLIASLGLKVAEDYARTASWLSALERGYAIELGIDGNPTRYHRRPEAAGSAGK